MACHRWSRQLRRLVGTALVLAAAGALAAVAGAGPDRIPPTFAGLESATTCVAGPGGGQTAVYRLIWEPAKDDVTPAAKIVYDIYQAIKPGGEDFSSPTYTTRRGATTFSTPPLSADTTFYFVVRARDRAGNRDGNTVERQGVNLCV